MLDVYLLFCLCSVQLRESFTSQVLQLGIGVLELGLDQLLVLLIASLDFVLLMALVPFRGAANCSHSIFKR